MDILQICVLIALGGILGGLAQSLNRFQYWPEHSTRVAKSFSTEKNNQIKVYFGLKEEFDAPFGTVSSRGTLWAIIIGMVVGLAGSFGLVGLFSLINVFHAADDFTLDAYHFTKIFGISVLGGYIARTTLAELGVAVKDRVLKAEKRVIDAESRIEETATEIYNSAGKIESNAIAVEHLAETDDKQKKLLDDLSTELAIERVKNALYNIDKIDQYVWTKSVLGITRVFNEHKDNRQAAILFARVLTERRPGDETTPDFTGAINSLTEFLNCATKSDNDESDVLYNRAYYYLMLAVDARDDRSKSELIQHGLVDIARSVELKEENKQALAEDRDFSPLWENSEFLAIIDPLRPTKTPQ
jgi:hypothetical protein